MEMETDYPSFEKFYSDTDVQAYVFMLCYHILTNVEDARDAAQETFLKIYKNWCCYDATKGEFKAWVSCIAKNAAIDDFRKRAKLQKREQLIGVFRDSPRKSFEREHTNGSFFDPLVLSYH